MDFGTPSQLKYRANQYAFHEYGYRPYTGMKGATLREIASARQEPRSGLLLNDAGPQTVEQLVARGELFMPPCDPELAILHDKRHGSWLALDDQISQVQERRRLYETNMTDIEWGKCHAFTDLYRHGWPPSPPQEDIFDKRMDQLYAEQRAERVAAWRDISQIKLQVPEAVLNYLSAFRRTELLKDLEGQQP